MADDRSSDARQNSAGPASSAGASPGSQSGPDFADPGQPQRAAPRPAPQMPSFEDAPGVRPATRSAGTGPTFADPEPQPEAIPQAPVQSPAPPVQRERKSPWPARIASALVLIAIIAIILGIFLPRERSSQRAQAGDPSPQPMPAVTPQPNNNTRVPARVSVSPQPTPQPQTNQNTRQSQQRTLFNQQQAQQLLQQVDGVERQQMGQALGVFIAMLRRPEYQDPESWEMMQAAMATSGVALIPGGPTMGHAEILGVIANAQNGAQAAAEIERRGARSILPVAVQQQIIAFLARSTDYTEAASGAREILSRAGVQLSPQAQTTLDQGILQAAQAKGQTTGIPSQ